MQPFGTDCCVVGRKNWSRVGSPKLFSLNQPSARSSALWMAGSWHLALHPRKERTRLLHQTYDEYFFTTIRFVVCMPSSASTI
jgi:hypothetical protein